MERKVAKSFAEGIKIPSVNSQASFLYTTLKLKKQNLNLTFQTFKMLHGDC